jgi:hypothetical protein
LVSLASVPGCENSTPRTHDHAAAQSSSKPESTYPRPGTFVVDDRPSANHTVQTFARASANAQREAQEFLRRHEGEMAWNRLQSALDQTPHLPDLNDSRHLRLIEIELIHSQIALLKQEPQVLQSEYLEKLADLLLRRAELPLAETSAQALVGLGDLARANDDRPLARASYMQAIRLLDQLRRHEIEHPQ